MIIAPHKVEKYPSPAPIQTHNGPPSVSLLSAQIRVSASARFQVNRDRKVESVEDVLHSHP